MPHAVSVQAGFGWKEVWQKVAVVGHRQGDLKLGQELEILLLRLLCEAGPHQQHPEVLCPDHPVLGHRPGALDVENPLQTFGQPDGVKEVEVPQAVAGVREVEQGAGFYEEADGGLQILIVLDVLVGHLLYQLL